VRASMRRGVHRAVVNAAPERQVVARRLPLEIDLVGRSNSAGSRFAPPEQEDRGPADTSTLPSVVSFGTERM